MVQRISLITLVRLSHFQSSHNNNNTHACAVDSSSIDPADINGLRVECSNFHVHDVVNLCKTVSATGVLPLVSIFDPVCQHLSLSACMLNLGSHNAVKAAMFQVSKCYPIVSVSHHLAQIA